jgi:DNA polymerase III epsilon subunit-like protein
MGSPALAAPETTRQQASHGALTAACDEVTFVALDLETTGLKASEDRIVELGVVKFRGGRVLDRKAWLINPGRPIPLPAQAIHGITSSMVSNSPTFGEVVPEFTLFCGDAVLMAHNARFDRRFLMAEFDRLALKYPENLLLDTLPLYRAWYPGLPSYALEFLTRELSPAAGHPLEPAASSEGDRAGRVHSALWDAECTAALFQKGLGMRPARARLGDMLDGKGGILSLQDTATRTGALPRPAAYSSSVSSNLPVRDPP